MVLKDHSGLCEAQIVVRQKMKQRVHLEGFVLAQMKTVGELT
jgi:hypothetical protein